MGKVKIPRSKQGALQVIKFHTKVSQDRAEALFYDLQRLADEDYEGFDVAGDPETHFSSNGRGFRYGEYKKNKGSLLVAFDYDGTWSKKPKVWEEVAKEIKKQGGSCVCITSRSKDTSDNELANSIGMHMKIIYASGKAKEKIAKDKGYSVDVWIDNDPETITKATGNMSALQKKRFIF